MTTTITPNSGTQIYQVANATGTVTATFQKTDNTATHALTVIIYENGRQLASQQYERLLREGYAHGSRVTGQSGISLLPADAL